jgi:hypothetical protein
MPQRPSASSLSLDPYVVDTLLPDLVGHDRQPSAFLVYLFLWRHSLGTGGTLRKRRIQQGPYTVCTERPLEGRVTARDLVVRVSPRPDLPAPLLA